MKHPGDIIYFLKFVGADILAVSAAVLITVLVTARYFLRRRGRKYSRD